MVKNLLTMQEKQETRVLSLGWEGPLEEEMATTLVFLLEKSHRVTKNWTQLSTHAMLCYPESSTVNAQ